MSEVKALLVIVIGLLTASLMVQAWALIVMPELKAYELRQRLDAQCKGLALPSTWCETRG